MATSGFLFGNVDADNKVEQDDGPLDKETREALSQLPVAMLGASTLLGDEEGADNESSRSAVPQEKARDAQDFSGERELAEEVTLSNSLQKPVALDTDDYDAPEKPASVAPIPAAPAAAPAPAPTLKRKEIEMPPLPLNLNNIRFSDVFIAPPPRAITRRPRHSQQSLAPRARPLIVSAADLELDETELLLTNVATSAPSDDRKSSAQDYTLPEDEAQLDEDDAPPAIFAKQCLPLPPEPAFLPVQQLAWEDDIIWSDSEVPAETQRPSTSAATPVVAPVVMDVKKEVATPLPKRPDTPKAPTAAGNTLLASGTVPVRGAQHGSLFDGADSLINKDDEDDDDKDDNNDEKEPGETDDEVDKEQVKTKERELAAVAAAIENKDAQRRRKVFRNANQELAFGNWDENITWGPTEAARMKAPPLVLDMNDRDLLFEALPDPVALAAAAAENGPAGSKSEPTSMDNAPTREEKKPKAVRKLSKSGLEVEPDLPRTQTFAELQRSGPLDPFNISLDKFYATTRAKTSAAAMAARAPLQHAVPAQKLSLVKTHLVKEDLVDFHRPKVNLAADGVVYKLLLPDPPKPIVSMLPQGEAQILKKKDDLSGREGRVVLLEYTEEYPPFVQNVGMASRFVAYWRRPRDPTQASTPPRFADGETVVLEPGDPSPFLGDITSERPVQAIENKLFKAPVISHAPLQTDFVLIRNKHSNKVYIREIQAQYVVGQVQPVAEVPAPNSRTANIYVRNRLQGFIFRFFKKKSNTLHRLRIQDLCKAFPNHSETSIRKRLKECADFQRAGDDNGWWTVKETFQLPTEEELRAMLTPEMTCAFESMLVGHQRLQEYGIDRITTLPGLATAIASLDLLGNRELSDKARMVEEQLKLTPWSLTTTFLSAISGRAQLQLTGAGDPSGRGEGFSFLRASQKPVAPKPKGPPGPKVVVTGTDADLRKLSLKQAREILLKMGQPEEKVQNLTRWDLIALIRKISSEAASAGDEPGLTKFARGARYTAHLAQNQYKEQCNAIFQQQLVSLARTEEEASETEQAGAQAEAQLEDFGKNLEEEMLRSANVDEREDEAELNRLMRDNASPTPGASLTSPSATSGAGATNPDGTPAGPPRKKVQYLKRTITTRNADGTETKKVEIIKDQALVHSYLAKQSTALEGLRKLKTHLTGQEEEEKNRVRKERRRLQEQLRRLRRNAEKQALNKEKLMAGDTESSVQSSLQLKCGACGMVGHMRTNRNCPLYEEPGKKGGDAAGDEEIETIQPPKKPSRPRDRERERERAAERAQSKRQAVTAEPTSPATSAAVSATTSGTKLKLFRKSGALGTPAAPPPTVATSGEGKVRIVVRKETLASLGSSAGDSGSRKRGRVERETNSDGESDAEDDFIERSRQQPGRRRKAEGVELANRMEQLWNEISANGFAAQFLKPVDRKVAPDYGRVVRHPIDMGMMRDRIRSFTYQSIDDFLADMRLMASNCHQYCDERYPFIPPQADALVQYAEERGAALKAQLAAEQEEGYGENDDEDDGEEEDASAAPESPHHGIVIAHAPTPPQPITGGVTITHAPAAMPTIDDVKPMIQ